MTKYTLKSAMSVEYPTKGLRNLSQTRKKAILDNVQRQRRQRTLTTIIIVAVIIGVIVTAVVLIQPTPNAVALPSYLDHCYLGTYYHSHPTLRLNINGSQFTIPANLGVQSSCNRPMHTHDTTGTIHVETDESRDYTLGDFFKIWGNWADSKTFATFNQNQLFGGHVDANHVLTMTVNNLNNTSFDALIIPRNAASGNNPVCSPSPGSTGPCSPFDIVITYASH